MNDRMNDSLFDDFDPVTFQGKLPSPCISLCVMQSDGGLCQGCHRTIDEIIGWSTADEDRKRTIWLAIRQRRGMQPVSSPLPPC